MRKTRIQAWMDKWVHKRWLALVLAAFALLLVFHGAYSMGGVESLKRVVAYATPGILIVLFNFWVVRKYFIPKPPPAKNKRERFA